MASALVGVDDRAAGQRSWVRDMFDGTRVHGNFDCGCVADGVELIGLFFEHHKTFHLLHLMLDVFVERREHVINEHA